MTSEAIPERLIVQARGGDPAALGRLLELYRNYLKLVARSLIGTALRVKMEPSDLVQETFLKAHRDFAGFEGRGEPEVMAWLRRILARTLADQVKHHRRKGRDLQRQESLDVLLDRSDETIHLALASYAASPSVGRNGDAIGRNGDAIWAETGTRLDWTDRPNPARRRRSPGPAGPRAGSAAGPARCERRRPGRGRPRATCRGSGGGIRAARG